MLYDLPATDGDLHAPSPEAAREALRLAEEVAGFGAWVLDLEDPARNYWSPSLYRLTGVPASWRPDFQAWLACIPADDRARVEAAVRRAVRREAGFEIAYRFQGPDGRMRWHESRGSVQRDSTAIVGVTLDVTEREQQLAEIGANERRLRLALEVGQMAVWDYDVATDALTGSPELRRLLGYGPDDEIDLAFLRARYYPGELQRIRQIGVEAIARGERTFEAEYRFYRLDGALRWYLLRAEVLFDRAGAPVRTFGVLLDTTSRKQAEADLRQREADLRAAVAAGKLATFEFDYTTHEFTSAWGMAALYGAAADREFTVDDARARYLPEDAVALADQLRAELRDPQVTETSWLFRIVLPDGRTRCLEGRGEYIRGADGRALRSRGIVQDVTERQQWEARQKILFDELSHRVKNTLAIVQSLAQQSLRHVPADLGRRDFEARLGALARAHNILTRQQWERVRLSDVMDATFEGALGGDRDRVMIEGPEVCLEPQVAVSFALAVHELCTNAIKYGALSAPEGSVTCAWELTGPDADVLRFEWRERGGPPVAEPSARGFGSRLIEGALASQIGGEARLSFEPDGLVCIVEARLPEPLC